MVFKDGDKVKCISDSTPNDAFGFVPLSIGSIYVCIGDEYTGSTGKTLIHVINDEHQRGGYYTERFVLFLAKEEVGSILDQFKNPKIDYFAINKECSTI